MLFAFLVVLAGALNFQQGIQFFVEHVKLYYYHQKDKTYIITKNTFKTKLKQTFIKPKNNHVFRHIFRTSVSRKLPTKYVTARLAHCVEKMKLLIIVDDNAIYWFKHTSRT